MRKIVLSVLFAAMAAIAFGKQSQPAKYTYIRNGHCISLSDETEYQEARSQALDRAAITSSAALLHSTDEVL